MEALPVKILFLTQYFPPEVGAPQNRLYELAIRLNQDDIKIDVLTAMPNYPQMEIYEGYKGKWFSKETMGRLDVHRAGIFVSKHKSIFFRLLNYFSFVFTSSIYATFRLKKYDYVFCESPPLFLGLSALWICLVKRSKLIFNVSDLWPESAEKLGLVKNKFFLKMATWLEEYLYKRAVLITGQTQGIVENIKNRFPAKSVYWLPNGVDLAFYDTGSITGKGLRESLFTENDFILFYGGIIGYAQGLDTIIFAAEKLKDYKHIKFVLQGSGPEKERLGILKADLNLENIFYLDVVNKEKMPEILKSIDAAIIPLKKLELFKGAIPSKIFETLAMKKPILLGVEGEAKKLFIDGGNGGLFFEPENADELADKILELYRQPELAETKGESGYKFVMENFSRDKIANELRQKIKEIA